MPGLQASAGNRALAAVLARGAAVQREDPPDPAKERVRTLRAAITDHSVPSGVKTATWPSGLYEWLNKQSGRHAELEGGYKSEYKTDANEDLVDKLGVDVGARSSAYLRFGTLRLADKLLFALYGTDFDLETMRRVLAKPSGGAASANTLGEAEKVFASEFTKHFPGAKSMALPNGQSSLIAGILDTKTLQWKRTGYELRALMAYGEFRLVDQLAAELEAPGLTVSWDKVLTLVDKAPDKSALKGDYKTSYNKDLAAEVGMFSPGDPADLGLLDNKHKYLAAVILAKGSVSLGERLRVAVKFKDDLSVVWNWLEVASPAEKKTAREEKLDPATMEQLSAEDKERLNALLAENPTALQKLTAAGADDGAAVLKVLKAAKGADRQLFADALAKGQATVGDPFVDFVARKTGGDFKNVKTILTGTVEERIRLALSGWDDDEDYVYSVLEAAADKDKVAILNQKPDDAASVLGLMKSKLSNKEFLKAQRLLLTVGANSMDPLERARMVKQFGDESLKDPGAGASMTNAYDALADENRELGWAVDKAGDKKSPGAAEGADLSAKGGSVLAAADSLSKTADSVNEVAAQIAMVAVGLVIAYFTAGAGATLISGAVEAFKNVAVRTAVAAVAKGTAKVVVNKIAKGDNFDVLGNDGMSAFLGGVVEGVTDVIAPSVVKGLVSPAYKEAMLLEGEKAAKLAWEKQSKIRQTATTIATGGGAAGLTSMAEASAQDDTWKQGLGEGVLKVLAKGAQGAATGAAVTAGVEIASPFLARQAARIGQLVQRFKLNDEAVRALSEAEAKWLVLRDQRRAKLGDIDTTGDDWPTVRKRLMDRKGGVGADDIALVVDERAALRDVSIARKKYGLPVGDTFAPPPEPRLIVDKAPPDTPAGPAKAGGPDDPLSMDIAGQKKLSLADKERLAEYMAGVRQMGASGTLTEAQVGEIADHALTKFTPADMPRPPVRMAKPGELDGSTLAAMNRGSWEMLVNPDLLAKPVEDMAAAMAHEARHAAQFYLIARYLAAENPGASIPELAAKMQGANHAMLAKAKAAPPLDLDSPQGATAHQLYVTEFAPAGNPLNPRTLWANDLREYMHKIEDFMARFRKIAEGKGPKAADAAEQIEVLERLYAQAEANYEFHRPLEVDAYMVDRLVKLGMNPGSFTKTPPGPTPVPAPPRNL
jgi:hypothetical protein